MAAPVEPQPANGRQVDSTRQSKANAAAETPGMRLTLMNQKVMIAVAIQAFFIAMLLAYFEPHVPLMNAIVDKLDDIDLPFIDLPWFEDNNDDDDSARDSSEEKAEDINDTILRVDKSLSVMSPKELSNYAAGDIIYLAILGRIYDVSKGKKHYGPGGGYNFFAGRDASRAFVTGDFTKDGLSDDVSGLTHQDYLGLLEWMQFYERDYKHIGYLSGTYYNKHAEPTEQLQRVADWMHAAQEWKLKQASVTARFPPCNSEWTQQEGGRVWCTTKSGGVTREWAGVPRRLFKPGTNDWRCACVKSSGAPLDDSLRDTNEGDLRHPHLRLFDNCPERANECKIK